MIKRQRKNLFTFKTADMENGAGNLTTCSSVQLSPSIVIGHLT